MHGCLLLASVPGLCPTCSTTGAKKAMEWSLGTGLWSGAWEQGHGVEPGNKAMEWSLGTGLVCSNLTCKMENSK